MAESDHRLQPHAAETSHDAGQASHGHEANTVRMLPIVLFGSILVVLTLVVLLLMRGMFSAYSTHLSQSQDQPSPLAATRQPPSEPRLQVSPAQDLRENQDAEEALLHRYGWVDRAAGVVHIPIQQAMELLLQRGLPVQREE
jgi:hypothetical protein